MTVPAPPRRFKAGTMVGRYLLTSLLGRGGMGEVWKAEDQELGRWVAIKLLPPNLMDDARLLRFKNEARAAAALSHPNLVGIYDAGDMDGVPYLVQEYIDGETLEQILRRGSVPLDSAIRWASQAAHGLALAHERGVLHRDIKPGNLIVGRDGRVRVLDFGLAKLESRGLSESESRLTTDGLVVGTAHYMSPEQATAQEIDSRSDIFSLGIVLYEMVAARSPFPGETPIDVLHAIVRTPYRPLDLPGTERLAPVIDRALQKSPARRYGSMGELATDLERLLSGATLPVSSGGIAPALASLPTSDMETAAIAIDASLRTGSRAGAVRLARRGGALALVAALVLLALVVASRRRLETPSTRRPVQVTSSAGLDILPTFAPDGASIAYTSDKGGGLQIWRKPLLAGGREISLTAPDRSALGPAWSPDGSRIAYHDKEKAGIWVVPATGGTALQVSRFGSRPAWSPDGAWIVFQSEPLIDFAPSSPGSLPPSTLWLVPGAGGEPRPLTRPGHPAGGHGAPRFSSDGRRVVFSSYDRQTSEIWWTSVNGSEQVRLAGGPGYRYDPVFSADGQAVYYCAVSESWDYSLQRLALQAGSGQPRGKSVPLLELGPAAIKFLSLSADGKRLAYSALTMSSNLMALPLDANGTPSGPPRPVTAETGRNTRASFSPDGARLAFVKWQLGSSQDVWVSDVDGANAVQRTTDPKDEDLPTWLGPGRLAFTSRRTGYQTLWGIDVTSGREALVADVGRDAEFLRPSPDASRVAYNRTEGGRINVWTIDLATRRTRAVTTDRELAGFPCWSPDGTRLGLEVKRGESTHIAVVSSDGGEVVQLTEDPGQAWPFSWAPDGDRIAFAGYRDGIWNLFWVSASTRQTHAVTANRKLNAYLRYPSWSPQGSPLVYEYAEATGNIWMLDVGK